MLSPAMMIFDLDGTLVDSAPGIRRCFSLTLEEWDRDADLEISDEMIGPPLHVTFAKLGFAPELVDDVVATYRRHYAYDGVRQCRAFPGVTDLLNYAEEHGIVLGVATSKFEPFAREILEHIGLANAFGAIVGDSLEQRRTKAEIAAMALSQLDSRRPAWMIGDRHFDMIAARELLLEGIGALWGYGTRAELEESGARFILEDPFALLGLLRETAQDADILGP